MKISTYKPSHNKEVIELFKDTFAEAESYEEGIQIAKLVKEMTESTKDEDIFGFVAQNDETVTGGIFFTRLKFKDPIEAFILSPVAVDTAQQGKGIGQKLINHGIDQLKQTGIQLLFTYGDPNFYSKVGFQTISEDLIKAPLHLSHPEGWLCQSINNETIPNIDDKPVCVSALNNPEYW